MASVRPGAPEILYNGIDENGNGQLDEGAQVNLLPAYCGVNLATVNGIIGIKTVSSAITKYRIRATNGNQVMYLERGVPHFNMTMFDGYAYATTYSVAIELQRYGVWLGYYGPECTVTTPGYNNTFSIVSPSCGSVLPALSTIIATTNGAGVTAYRFRVTNLSEPLGPYL